MSYEYARGTVLHIEIVETERPNDFLGGFSKIFMQNGFNSLPLRQASAVCKMMLM